MPYIKLIELVDADLFDGRKVAILEATDCTVLHFGEVILTGYLEYASPFWHRGVIDGIISGRRISL